MVAFTYTFFFFKRALQSYFCTIIVCYGIVVLHEFLNNMYAKVARYKSLELILFFLALPLQCSSLSCLQYFAVGKICKDQAKTFPQHKHRNKNLFLGSCGWWAKLDLHSTTAFAHLSLALIWKMCVSIFAWGCKVGHTVYHCVHMQSVHIWCAGSRLCSAKRPVSRGGNILIVICVNLFYSSYSEIWLTMQIPYYSASIFV